MKFDFFAVLALVLTSKSPMYNTLSEMIYCQLHLGPFLTQESCGNCVVNLKNWDEGLIYIMLTLSLWDF